MLRLLWISHFLPFPPTGGNLLRSYNLIRELSAKLHLDLIALVQPRAMHGGSKSLAEGTAEGYAALGKLCKSVSFIELESESYPLGRERRLLEAIVRHEPYDLCWLKTKKLRSAIARQVQEHQYDAVHVDTVGLHFVRDVLPERGVVLNHHNVESHMQRRRSENESRRLHRWLYHRESHRLKELEARCAGQYAIHLVCSELDGERLATVAPHADWTVIPNGVDCEYFRPGRDRKRTTDIVFVGSLNWYPNASAMDWFLDAMWPILARENRGVAMTIVGGGASGKLTREVQQTEGVRLAGFVPDVRPYLNESRVFVCPIFEGGGTKLKILDAFAMGIPVVAHPAAMEGIGAIRDEHVAIAETPEEFVVEIDRLLGNEDLAEAMGKRAREFVVKTYGWPSIGERLLQAYESVERMPAHAFAESNVGDRS